MEPRSAGGALLRGPRPADGEGRAAGQRRGSRQRDPANVGQQWAQEWRGGRGGFAGPNSGAGVGDVPGLHGRVLGGGGGAQHDGAAAVRPHVLQRLLAPPPPVPNRRPGPGGADQLSWRGGSGGAEDREVQHHRGRARGRAPPRGGGRPPPTRKVQEAADRGVCEQQCEHQVVPGHGLHQRRAHQRQLRPEFVRNAGALRGGARLLLLLPRRAALARRMLLRQALAQKVHGRLRNLQLAPGKHKGLPEVPCGDQQGRGVQPHALPAVRLPLLLGVSGAV
mmetsp:Transcript_80947/g.121678  ORF Transcript_80947/g.121678 Transcript_80947/m.121678 type:complete len:279 (+) Transcript_80947:271-1107(+)